MRDAWAWSTGTSAGCGTQERVRQARSAERGRACAQDAGERVGRVSAGSCAHRRAYSGGRAHERMRTDARIRLSADGCVTWASARDEGGIFLGTAPWHSLARRLGRPRYSLADLGGPYLELTKLDLGVDPGQSTLGLTLGCFLLERRERLNIYYKGRGIPSGGRFHPSGGNEGRTVCQRQGCLRGHQSRVIKDKGCAELGRSLGITGEVRGYAFSIREATIHDIQMAFKQYKLTSRELVELYIGEIRRSNPVVHGVIEVNPDALWQANKVDAERKVGAASSSSPLHGIPILLKDNIATKDGLNTTAAHLHCLARLFLAMRCSGEVKEGGGNYLGEGHLGETVSDAVEVLDAIVGFDWKDAAATREASKFIPYGGYKQFLKPYGVKGKRQGVVRNPFSSFPSDSTVIQAFESHLHTLRQSGAILVNNLEINEINTILNATHSGEALALVAEFKLALNAYLKDLIISPEKIGEFGQDIFLMSENTNGIGLKEKQGLMKLERLSREEFEKIMMENKLDALKSD
ncbi:hypothetical protein Syun_028148 [Stephania yunnanensis]|uniref:Amidase domain-containing protein n=1 Tax=Stephania yunnanensis TaxID=152371 RepID=A0AAP0HQK6_9MAGN